MSDLPENLDLKFLPDWLKETESPGNRYADFEGEAPRRDRDDRRGGPRPGGDRGFGGPRGPRPGGPGGPGGRDQRGPRRDGPGGGPGAGPRGPRPGGPGGAPSRSGPPNRGGRDDRGPRRDDRGPRRDDRGPRREDRPAPAPIKPLAVKVEFIPEAGMLSAIAKEMKSTHRAYPVFTAAKMILNKPQLHRVRVTTTDPETTLFQLGDGPIASDRSMVERDAFRLLKDKYYREEVVQNDPPKGNFANVARLRASGLFLGPTNHHSYQPNLRRIYEERYSRRMSFGEFQREIEIVTDEQAINDWKEQARSVVTYFTTQEPEPVSFKTTAEVEAHFRQKYLPQEVKSGTTFEVNGTVLRNGPDRALGAAIGDAFDREYGFPHNVVNAMRPVLTDAGLTFFKHRKRIVYATSNRPVRHPEGQPARDAVLAILRTIEANPRCSRHDLALKLLGEHFEAPEKVAEKTALATDLHYLLLAGHVIEFVDGRLDLPLPPKGLAETAKGETEEAGDESEPATAEASPSPAIAVEATETAEAPETPIAEAPESAIAGVPESTLEAAAEHEPVAEETSPAPAPAAEAAETPIADVPQSAIDGVPESTLEATSEPEPAPEVAAAPVEEVAPTPEPEPPVAEAPAAEAPASTATEEVPVESGTHPQA
jgi:hypothetical protein